MEFVIVQEDKHKKECEAINAKLLTGKPSLAYEMSVKRLQETAKFDWTPNQLKTFIGGFGKSPLGGKLMASLKAYLIEDGNVVSQATFIKIGKLEGEILLHMIDTEKGLWRKGYAGQLLARSEEFIFNTLKEGKITGEAASVQGVRFFKKNKYNLTEEANSESVVSMGLALMRRANKDLPENLAEDLKTSMRLCKTREMYMQQQKAK